MKTVAILGASGYAGGELLRLLLFHKELEVVKVFSKNYVGKPVHEAHPHLRGFYKNLKFEDLSLDSILKADIVFNALPHLVGMHLTAQLYEHGVTIVDLSADFRLKKTELYKTWYGIEHPYPDLLEKFVYSLPEINRESIKGKKLLSIPGCNSTAAILAIAPLFTTDIVKNELVIADVKVGSSEGGRTPYEGSHHPEREGSLRPYSPEGHRHQAEVEMVLSELRKSTVNVSLVPHATSAVRGSLASVHVLANKDVSEKDLWIIYARFYRESPFIRIVYSSKIKVPDTKNVVGSNFADISFSKDKTTNRVTGFAAIDNLVKGAAGQAIQALNIALGLREDEGLLIPPLKPS